MTKTCRDVFRIAVLALAMTGAGQTAVFAHEDDFANRQPGQAVGAAPFVSASLRGESALSDGVTAFDLVDAGAFTLVNAYTCCDATSGGLLVMQMDLELGRSLAGRLGTPEYPDLNDDLAINFPDLQAMKAAFCPSGDLDGDGVVNFADLQIMKALFFLAPGPSGVAVPPAG